MFNIWILGDTCRRPQQLRNLILVVGGQTPFNFFQKRLLCFPNQEIIEQAVSFLQIRWEKGREVSESNIELFPCTSFQPSLPGILYSGTSVVQFFQRIKFLFSRERRWMVEVVSHLAVWDNGEGPSGSVPSLFPTLRGNCQRADPHRNSAA